VPASEDHEGAPGSLVGRCRWRRTLNREPDNHDRNQSRADIDRALAVSLQSVAWTLTASTAAILIGARTHTAVLVAFGAVGLVDMVGSVALAYHFRHGLQHDRLSDQLETLAHRLVLVGLLVVGISAVATGIVRFIVAAGGAPSDPGLAIAGASVLVLSYLSARKRSMARRVGSDALRSDGHLSAIGALQAAVTLSGAAVTRWLGWDWADALATTAVGSVAVTVAVVSWWAGNNGRNPRRKVDR